MRRLPKILLAAALVAAAARAEKAPSATVPPPRSVAIGDLEAPPCWSCLPESEQVPHLRVDLDAVAPLGNGSGNAATFFAAFASPESPRSKDLAAARKRRDAVAPDAPNRSAYLLTDDPIVVEAMGWADQAWLRVDLPRDEWRSPAEPPLINTMLPIHLVKAWVKRGDGEQSGAAAREHYRRCIRLGRLLLQDDRSWMQNRIARQCIRHGASALHRRALLDGDCAEALIAGRVLAEVDGALLLDRLLDDEIALRAFVVKSDGATRLVIPEARVKALADRAKTSRERTWRLTALDALRTARLLGTPEIAAIATSAIETCRTDKDRLVAAAATWSATAPWTALDDRALADSP